jgi:hypothetical protein
MAFPLGHHFRTRRQLLWDTVSAQDGHYHEERPHQGVGNVPLPEAGEDAPRVLKFPSGEIKCRERLGGLLKHYYCAAA